MQPSEPTDPWHTIHLEGGTIRFPLVRQWHRIGDRRVPSPIVLQLRTPDEPVLDLTVEVVDGVPRATDLHLWRQEDGREIRAKHLKVQLDDLVEVCVAVASASKLDDDWPWRGPLAYPKEERERVIRQGMRVVRDARARSRRALTTAHLKSVAELYQKQDVGALEAVADAYAVDKSTAYRWIKKAREAGLLPERGKDSPA